jgi:hypothetical protein
MTPYVGSIVLELAQHEQKQTRMWLDGNALNQLDYFTTRRIIERQNAMMVLLMSELELEKGIRRYD